LSIKDNFSTIAAAYAAWRPEYPEALFEFLSSLTVNHSRALDCGTGNGQAAKLLARYFDEVYATDISETQLQHAVALPNIYYSISSAEKTDFPDHYFDIICAAQAAHWFNHTVFYKEAARILKPGGVLAFVGYALIQVDAGIDDLIQELYTNVLGNYWDKERKFIDDHYHSMPFPYTEILAPEMEIQCEWNLLQLYGYLSTWSALQHYKKMNVHDPLQGMLPAFKKLWGNEYLVKTVRFPVISKITVLN
jgi:SAM-dependent methyltransferase